MSDSDLKKLVTAWITAAGVDVDSPEYELNAWAYDEVQSYALKNPEALWQFILAAYKEQMSEQAEAVFAASPLEILIHLHGATYIDRIEALAKTDERFAYMLGGVWFRDTIPPDVWSRVEAVRREAP